MKRHVLHPPDPLLRPRSSPRREGVFTAACKPRFSAANHKNIPHDQRAIGAAFQIVKLRSTSQWSAIENQKWEYVMTAPMDDTLR
jgi:hypothetical protein